ncbi:MAG: carboxyl transferase domain-containing protein [Nitratireductor sp.]
MTYVFSQDFTVFGGSLSRRTQRRSARSWIAMRNGAPVVSINDSGGARIRGVASLRRRLCRCVPDEHAHSGVMPQISMIAKTLRGQARMYSPATDRFHLHGEGYELHVRDNRTC